MTGKSRKPKRAADAKPKSAHAGPDASASNDQSHGTGYASGVLLPAMLSAIGLWASFAPLNFSPLAWIAPIGWLLIVEREKPVGRRGYFSLWLSGCLFWLLILHGIRLAFWPLYFGWLLLSLYLAVYVPIFVGVARSLRHRWRVPLAGAAPIAWVAMEMIRSYLITGFAGNTLAHSQAHRPSVIQLADQLGTGGIGFVMMTVCAAFLVSALALRENRERGHALGAIAVATLMFSGLLSYGWWKLVEADRLESNGEPLLRVLLVQENTPTIFEHNEERSQLAWTRYLSTTRAGVKQHGQPHLVVWPESTFTANEPWLETKFTHGLPAELSAAGIDEAYLNEVVEEMQRTIEFKMRSLLGAAMGRDQPWEPQEAVDANAPYMLVGNEVHAYDSDGRKIYNAALFIGPDARSIDRYSKMHLVMVGEYLPLGPALRWLGELFGQVNIEAGREPKSFAIETERGVVRVSPSICFESMVPQLIRRQVRTLAEAGNAPDILINISNDSWFRGSSALDHHLASSILVAVENRRPMLVAANTGISAEISGAGRVRQAAGRLVGAALLAQPHQDSRVGLVQWIGYPLGWLCVLASCLALVPTGRRPSAAGAPTE